MSRRPVLALAVAAALAAPVAACSGSPTPQENTASACDAYASFTETVSNARESIDSSSTIEQIRTERDNIRNAYEDLQPALESVAEDRRTALEDAWQNFDQAVAGIDDSMTVPQAASSLTDDVQQLRSARDGLADELDC